MSKSGSAKHGLPEGRPHAPTIRNRKAFHEYHVLERVEAGLALMGTEVKSLREGKCQLDEAYVRIDGNEAWLISANIATYPQARGVLQHDPVRSRKLLLHRRQIEQLRRHTAQKGRTLVPLAVYFAKGYAKVEVGIAEGKQAHDKRQAIKERQAHRDMQRETHRRR